MKSLKPNRPRGASLDVSAAQRARQTARLLRTEGAPGIMDRLRRRAAARLAPSGYSRLPVSREHLVRAAEIAADGRALPGPAPYVVSEPMTIAWIAVPPHPGVGGHQTMFRMVGALEQAGHVCVLYLYDRHGWSMDQHIATVRSGWPHIRAEVRNLSDGIEDAHALFATSWETAYPALASPAAGARCYFVQDFEPLFYPAGSEALLAEATYGFGFHGVTAGKWLALKLNREYGMSTDHFDFGCDLDHYRLERSHEAGSGRSGICYYCRPGTPRRAYELAMMALDLFAEMRPDIEIHLFGRPAGKPSFPVTDHGLLRPAELNTLYNRCIAGLCLSATNSSLVPHEMLGAGCIPVVNDAEHNRLVLDNPHIAYSAATPFHLADALRKLVDRPADERNRGAIAAAESVRSTTWEQAGHQFERAVRNVVQTRSAEALAA
jgi:O-antigen biosynthesis protein